MSDVRRREAMRIAEEARKYTGQRRRSFVAEVCADAPELRAEVERILREDSHDSWVSAPTMEMWDSEPTLELAPEDFPATVEMPMDWSSLDSPPAPPPEDEATAETDAPWLVGQTLGTYRILQQIGEGGMGKVFVAEDQTLRRKVAIKILPDAASRGEAKRRRLFREARAAASIQHPNIASVYAISEEAGHTFIAMELVRGRNLFVRLLEGRLSIRETVNVAVQVADALATVHAAGMVYRDLKPGNVMITPSGQVKLIDFGLAKSSPKMFPVEMGSTAIDPDEEDDITRDGYIVGSPTYMSPEQATGQPLDARSDVYALGLLMFEMLLGHKPFDTAMQTHTITLEVIDGARRVPLDSLDRVGVPPALKQLIGEMVEHSAEARVESCREVVTRLRALRL